MNKDAENYFRERIETHRADISMEMANVGGFTQKMEVAEAARRALFNTQVKFPNESLEIRFRLKRLDRGRVLKEAGLVRRSRPNPFNLD